MTALSSSVRSSNYPCISIESAAECLTPSRVNLSRHLSVHDVRPPIRVARSVNIALVAARRAVRRAWSIAHRRGGESSNRHLRAYAMCRLGLRKLAQLGSGQYFSVSIDDRSGLRAFSPSVGFLRAGDRASDLLEHLRGCCNGELCCRTDDVVGI